MSDELCSVHNSLASISPGSTPKTIDKELKEALVKRLETKRLYRRDSDREKGRRNSKKLRRSVSAIEASRSRERPRIRRSISERCPDEKLLHIPKRCKQSSRRSRSRPSSELSVGSESSCRTASSQPASVAELVAQELGLKEIPGKGAKEARRRRAVWAITLTSVALLTASVLLVAITLLLSPAVDALQFVTP
ncbi:uncharacterized protein LOC111627082 [Centruroides sculpturatus]|uniref:uncharacterized protein LOC111627081 n=1 Tax=Centruroides sculpturatus TaxID=218467 RepID=UPI000C6D48FA|nr:uncharacterized protein LOC111627081 [Centruroides sculpturatus]XP_023226407.1 uncharacterized protein LOC111627082 [Centruroides sculpturatus]